MKYTIHDSKDMKTCTSEDYNFIFNKKTGFFARWGKTKEADPQSGPFAEILDLECTTICSGVPDKNGKVSPCKFCYKGNTSIGKNMSLDTFKTILGKFSKGLTQIAFGADSTGTSNPDMFPMMEYARSEGIIPNVTLANISNEVADKVASLCGACAVSRYENKDICYDSVKRLTDRRMSQVNIHILASDNTYDQCIETINDMSSDPRLAKMNALVFLALKKKGRGITYNSLPFDKFKAMIELAMEKKIYFGMDSCSANKFLLAVKDYPDYKKLEQVTENCESSLFSAYIDVDGMYYPCSFCPGIDGLEGISLLEASSMQEVWNSAKIGAFRAKLMACGRACPIYKI
jgi:hypothetical protein